MTQKATFRSLFRTLPGHMYTPPQECETESMCSPFRQQELELVIAGADPFIADATFTYTFPLQDGSGLSGEVSTVVVAGTTLADATDQIAAAWAANGQAAQLYSATSDGVDTITLVANSHLTSIPAASFVDAWTDAHTATTTQTVAAAAPSLEMGLFYVFGVLQAGVFGITGTPRQARPAALPTGATVIADLRGVIAREPNSTTQRPDFSNAGFDSYPAGRVWPGMLRGEIAVRVDPASGTIGLASQVHVVIAAGAYSVIGSVADAADGGNTIRIDNAPTGNIMARVIQVEETFAAFSGFSGRYVALKVNRTN